MKGGQRGSYGTPNEGGRRGGSRGIRIGKAKRGGHIWDAYLRRWGVGTQIRLGHVKKKEVCGV